MRTTTHLKVEGAYDKTILRSNHFNDETELSMDSHLLAFLVSYGGVSIGDALPAADRIKDLIKQLGVRDPLKARIKDVATIGAAVGAPKHKSQMEAGIVAVKLVLGDKNMQDDLPNWLRCNGNRMAEQLYRTCLSPVSQSGSFSEVYP